MDSGKKESMITQIHQIYIRATPEAIGARPRRWRMVLDISDLKSLLEIGKPLAG